MTRPRVSRERLILSLSRSLADWSSFPFPRFADFAHSDPARSTQCSFPETSSTLPSSIFFLASTRIVKMQCDRDDCLFMFVSPTWRCRCALRIKDNTCSAESTVCSERPLQILSNQTKSTNQQYRALDKRHGIYQTKTIFPSILTDKKARSSLQRYRAWAAFD